MSNRLVRKIKDAVNESEDADELADVLSELADSYDTGDFFEALAKCLMEQSHEDIADDVTDY